MATQRQHLESAINIPTINLESGEMNASFMVPGAPCEALRQTATVASDEKLDRSRIIAMFNI